MQVLRNKVAVLALFFSPGLMAQDSNPVVVLDEIVAKVNSEVITLTDLQRETKTLRDDLNQQIQDPKALEEQFEERKKMLLVEIIQKKLLIQKAEELGVTANIEVDVSAYIEEIRKENNIPNMEVFEQALQRQGLSMAVFRQNIRERLIQESLLGQFVYSKITLLTPEIEAFYQENLDQFTEQPEVELSEILLLTEGKDKAQVRQRAEEALARLQSGTSFEEVAKEYSDGPTAGRAGVIGTFKKGSLAQEIEDSAFKLEEGQSSGVIETEFGLQIIKVLKKSAAKQKSLEEVRPQIQRFLYAQKAQPEVKEFLEDLRTQSYIYVAPKYREQYNVEELFPSTS
ncbi:MAG: peptidylprolyl isomerase [Acidobacteriota bacterium]